MSLVALKPSQELVDLVGSLGGQWHGRVAMCRCPSHADNRPSLSLRQGNRGILVTCFAGCDRENVLRELRRVPNRGPFTYNDGPLPHAGNVERLWAEAQPVEGTLAQRYLECQRRSKSRPFGGVKPGHRVTCRGEWREGVARGPLPPALV